ncbi:hypothetical protein HLB42_18145 (plasmid) [Deinococcus sp. D7000]|nr:hypothetical protein HLB42_18145 [Deinococcus sp. D7000]
MSDERHAWHFLNMVEGYQRRWQREGLNSFEADLPHYPNIRAGLIWTVERRRSDLAYRFLGAVGGLWAALGLHVQEAPLAERVLALPPPEDRGTLLRALKISANTLNFLGQLQAREARLLEIVALCRELGDLEGGVGANLNLADVMRETGRLEQAWTIRQQLICDVREWLGDQPATREQQRLRAFVYICASTDLLELGRHAQALEYAQLACQYLLELGDRVGSAPEIPTESPPPVERVGHTGGNLGKARENVITRALWNRSYSPSCAVNSRWRNWPVSMASPRA